jgi:hypothetical protein
LGTEEITEASRWLDFERPDSLFFFLRKRKKKRKEKGRGKGGRDRARSALL